MLSTTIEKMEKSREISMDQVFIQKLTDTVFENLHNEQFGAEELASQIGFSRSQIHRRLHLINGKSITEFIREIRLKEAHRLLENNVDTASEIAYRVGFGSPTYFNKCFHEFYGYTPGDVKRNYKNSGNQNYTGDKKDGNKRYFRSKNSFPLFRKYIKSKIPLSRHLMLGIIFVLLILIVYLLSLYYLRENTSKKTEKSIAVLPFENLSNNPDDQYLADGVMESILNHLQRIGDLKVISRNSTEQYRKTSRDIKAIGKELNADYILQGSFQKAGNQANLMVLLVEVKTDEVLWTNNFIRDWSDIFKVQKDVAQAIADELYIELSDETQAAWQTIPTKNMQAYNLYLKGRELMASYGLDFDEKKLPEAAHYFGEATKMDKNFCLAFAGLASVNLRQAQSIEDLEKVYKTAGHALKLDPYNGSAYIILGKTLEILYWDSAAARHNFDIAIKLEPNNPGNYSAYFEHEYVLGNYEKLVKIYDQIVYRFHKDPINIHELKLLRCQKRYDEMAKIADENSDEAKSWGILKLFFYGYLYTAKYNRAHLMIREMKKYVKDKRLIFPCEGMLYAMTENKAGAYAIIDSLNVLSKKIDVSGVAYAQIYAALGEKELMYQYLEDALAVRHIEMTYLYKRPAFDPYRNEPRFQDIWRRAWIQIPH